MSNAPEQRPAYRRPITVEIPVTWTPEQALAVYELLDELRERIWEIYNRRTGEVHQVWGYWLVADPNLGPVLN